MYEVIVDQILESILRGDLKPNDKLPSEKELGDTLGVSRVTVREAILSLEQYGIVEVRQGSTGGAYIKEIDLAAVARQMVNALKMTNLTFPQLAEARAVIEEAVMTRMLASRIDANQLGSLENTIKKAEAHYKNGENKQRLLANFSFHTKLAEMTANPIIILMHKLIVDLSLGFYEDVEPTQQMIEKTIADHYKVVELLREGKFQEAANHCSSHIRKVSGQIVEKSKKQSLLKGSH